MQAKPGYIYPIIGTALVLFVLGIFLLLSLHTQAFVAQLKENIDAWVEMHADATPDQAAQLITNLKQHPYIVPESVNWMSNEQAAESIKQELGDEQVLDDLPTMMRDVVQFHLRAQQLNKQDMQQVIEQLKSDTLVAEVFIEADKADKVAKNLTSLGRIALALGMLLILISIILIHNTVRLALYTNRLIVKNMQMVGATPAFIQAPYLKRAALNGLLSALIAITLLIGCLYLLSKFLKGMEQIESLWSICLTFATLLVIGLVISILSTWFTLRKYLDARAEDLQ